MSEEVILSSLKTVVSGLVDPQTSQPFLAATYTDVPNFESDVLPAPFALIQPGTLVDAPIESDDNQMAGPYTIMYFDELGDGASLLTVAAIMKTARRFARALRAALRADHTMGNTCVWAGKGEGTVMHYADAGMIQPFGQMPYWTVPVDVDTLDFANE